MTVCARSACAAPLQGSAAGGAAAPLARPRPLGQTWPRPGRLAAGAASPLLALRVLLALLVLPSATLAQTGSDPPAGLRFTAEQIESGRAQFHRTCAQCHGRNMVNSGTTIYDLRKFPVDDPERFKHSVTEGKGNMPSFKEALTPEQVSVLWAYVGTRGGKELQ